MELIIMIGRWAVQTLWASVLVAAAAGSVYAQQPTNTEAQPATATDSQKQAREILMRMAQFLAKAPAFNVSLTSSYDAVQESGQKIEFGERRKVVLSRPDRLRIEAERSDGSRTDVVFTGKEIVLVDLTNKVYATEPQPGGLDESIVHFVSDLGMRFPLAVLLMSRLPEELEKRVRSIDYVEKTNLYGTPSHHLAARTDTVDFQIWVADGAQPVPLRAVVTYRNDPGQPAFRAMFIDWNFAPAITDATFTPQIPDGAKKIAFAAQLAAASRATRKPGSNNGAKK
ncbi:MAG: DUF2092 domain-containing protein [Pseudomonadota bacterium]